MESEQNEPFELEACLAMNQVTIIQPGDIEIIKPAIGQGGFGKVYKGSYQGNDVAIKKLKISWEDSGVIQEISNEIGIIKIAEHERLPKFYGIWKNKNHFHLIFEFIHGPTLKEVYKSMSKTEKLNVILQLAEILAIMHKKKLIHRDIKPGNVMIENEKDVRLIDFGISKIASKTQTYTKVAIGTLPYMAPEQFDVDEEADPDTTDKPVKVTPKVDIWALGCMTSEMFSSIVPWFNKAKNEMALQRHLFMKTPFPIPDAIDEDVKKIIRNMVEIEPDERWTADQVVEEIKKLI